MPGRDSRARLSDPAQRKASGWPKGLGRIEDERLARGEATFVGGIPSGAWWAAFVRSELAHAKVVGVDLGPCRESAGVVGAYAPGDLAGFVGFQMGAPGAPDVMGRPWLATDTVRYLGEPLAVVVAHTKAEAERAARQAQIRLEPLDAVVDPTESARGEVVLFPGMSTNVALAIPGGEREDFFDGCEVVVEVEITHQRLVAAPLETRAILAQPRPGGVVVHAASQAPHAWRSVLAAATGLGEGDVVVIVGDVGGAFGSRIAPSGEEIALTWLACHLGHGLRWSESRAESMLSMGHGRGQTQKVALGGTRAGRMIAYRLEVLQDCGAYPMGGAILPMITRAMCCGPYGLDRFSFSSQSVVTNTAPMVEYRGAGQPEATSAIERAVDVFAATIGMDPAEVRRANLIPTDRFPYTAPTGVVYDGGDYRRALDVALERSRYQAWRADQARRRRLGDRVWLGVGLASYVKMTNFLGGKERAMVAVDETGHTRVVVSSAPSGQGHQSAFGGLVAGRLGVDPGGIEVVLGDTSAAASGGGTFASRSLQAQGSALVAACDSALAKAQELDARLLAGALKPAVADWPGLARMAGGTIVGDAVIPTPPPTTSYGTHVAVVEVDSQTGEVRVVAYVAADDAGRLANAGLARGQLCGGIAQGIAEALYEGFSYAPTGAPTTAGLAAYGVPYAPDLPHFDLYTIETPSTCNPLGARGIGESGVLGALGAVHNAVVDALSHLGVTHIDTPLRPERVWQAIRDAEAGG